MKPDAVFRLNPDYALVGRASLAEAVLRQCGILLDDPHFYGLLVPRREGALSVKAVQRGDASLLLLLQQPGCVPPQLRRQHPDLDAYLSRLVLDRVLEVERAGAFVSGPASQELAAPSAPADRSPVSDRALLHGARLRLRDPAELARRLYTFNRIPAGAAAIEAWRDRAIVRRYLGAVGQAGLQAFREVPPVDERRCWMEWTRQARGTSAAAYKLYVCVQPEALPGVFGPCAGLAARHGAQGLKVGADRVALNRPDKFMLYFATAADLHACVPDLVSVLADAAPHELPFAGALPSPALAWGIDPPDGQDGVPWLRETSWRLWVCRKLAAALLLAMDDGRSPGEAAAFAKRRVALDGIDPESWAPVGTPFA